MLFASGFDDPGSDHFESELSPNFSVASVNVFQLNRFSINFRLILFSRHFRLLLLLDRLDEWLDRTFWVEIVI